VSSITIFELIGGLGLFLFGIKIMGEALQDLAGDKLRQLIASLTSTPVKGVFVGALVTILIQSSSATTVMSVSFVHAGLMTLKQAVGVIMGANIGTTVTAQLIAFKIKHYALPIIGIGMFLSVFGRTKKQKYIGSGLVGFGLLFLGMEHMGNSMSFLQGRKDIFLAFSSHPVLGVLAGAVVTMLVQSSSATIGLTIAMAVQGLIDINIAIPILLGDNVGTTITAVLASLGSNRSAKQAAAAHVLFNLIGVAIFLLAMPLFKYLVFMTADDIGRQIANAHTLFNVTNTLIFLPFVNLFVKLIQRIVPSKGEFAFTGAQYLDTKLINVSPAAAVDGVRKEIVRMGEVAMQMLEDVRLAFVNDDFNMVQQVNQTEKIINELTHQIADYGAKMWEKSLSEDLSIVLSAYVNGVSDIERIGDHAQNMVELYEYKVDHKLVFSEKAREEFNEMFTTTQRSVQLSMESVRDQDPLKAREVIEVLENKIDSMEKELRKKHIKRLNKGKCHPSSGVIFIDILSNLERIGDHAHNISYLVLDITRMTGERKASKEDTEDKGN
jgi:phosphate:Na+ symporter